MRIKVLLNLADEKLGAQSQDYSITNHLAAIESCAFLHHFEIVKTYSDPGRSGVDLARRPGLRALLDEVANAIAKFQVVLVYDVTRWGRFQDIDESAYYEFFASGQEYKSTIAQRPSPVMTPV